MVNISTGNIVSIHAPVMDAKHGRGSNVGKHRFNPRARDGREGMKGSCNATFTCFNPRARDGRETFGKGWARRIVGFNPRARDGREFIKIA